MDVHISMRFFFVVVVAIPESLLAQGTLTKVLLLTMALYQKSGILLVTMPQATEPTPYQLLVVAMFLE